MQPAMQLHTLKMLAEGLCQEVQALTGPGREPDPVDTAIGIALEAWLVTAQVELDSAALQPVQTDLVGRRSKRRGDDNDPIDRTDEETNAS